MNKVVLSSAIAIVGLSAVAVGATIVARPFHRITHTKERSNVAEVPSNVGTCPKLGKFAWSNVLDEAPCSLVEKVADEVDEMLNLSIAGVNSES